MFPHVRSSSDFASIPCPVPSHPILCGLLDVTAAQTTHAPLHYTLPDVQQRNLPPGQRKSCIRPSAPCPQLPDVNLAAPDLDTCRLAPTSPRLPSLPTYLGSCLREVEPSMMSPRLCRAIVRHASAYGQGGQHTSTGTCRAVCAQAIKQGSEAHPIAAAQ